MTGQTKFPRTSAMARARLVSQETPSGVSLAHFAGPEQEVGDLGWSERADRSHVHA
jgi:hypothetical protein